MKEGDVILTPIPQADGTIKNRPAIVLREMPRYLDLLVCGVSTQLHQRIDGFDEVTITERPRFRDEWIIIRIVDKTWIPSGFTS